MNDGLGLPSSYKVSSYEEALSLMTFEVPDYMNVPKNSKFANFLANNVSRMIRFSLLDDISEVEWNHPNIIMHPEKGIGYGLFVAHHPDSIFSLDENFSTRIGNVNALGLIHKTDLFFRGKRVLLPKNLNIDTTYKNFEDYTSVSEENHLSRWACVVLKFLSSAESRIGKEIQLLEENNLRDGRLDVCAITDNKLLILEAKVGIQAALEDNRFRYRIPSYFSESAKIIKASNNPVEHMIVLLVGGSELSLFPPGHSDHQASAYQLGSSFLTRCLDSDVRIITANFLWCCLMKSLVTGSLITWDKDLWGELSKPDTLGLTSAGRLKSDGTIEYLKF
jgi:hypothetical protein